MQQIERYGVIALLFLMVTLVTVGLWGDGSAQTPEADDAVADQELDELTPRERRSRADGLRASEARRRERDEAPLAFDRDEATRQAAERRAAERRERDALRAAEKERRLAQLPPTTQPARAETTRPMELQGFGYEPARRDTTRRSGALAGDRPRRDESEALGVPGPVSVQTTSRKKASEPERPAGRPYTVQPGDSLARIAGRELGDQKRWPEIQKLNGIRNPDIVVIGSRLVLPDSGEPAPSKARLATNTPSVKKKPQKPAAGTRTYVVRKGDMLSRVAQDQCGTVKALPRIVALNPGLDPDKILVGMKLVLPAAEARDPDRALLADAGSTRSASNRRGDKRYIVQ